jgi:hypothetical protein
MDPQYGSATKTSYTDAEHQTLLEARTRTLRHERDYELTSIRASHAAEISELRGQIAKLEAAVVERQEYHRLELEQREAHLEQRYRMNPEQDMIERKERERVERDRINAEREEHARQQHSLPQVHPMQRPYFDSVDPETEARARENERLAEEKRIADDRELFRQQQASLPHAQQPVRGFVQPGPDPMRPGERPESREAREREKQPAVPYRDTTTVGLPDGSTKQIAEPEPTPGTKQPAQPGPDEPARPEKSPGTRQPGTQEPDRPERTPAMPPPEPDKHESSRRRGR